MRISDYPAMSGIEISGTLTRCDSTCAATPRENASHAQRAEREECWFWNRNRVCRRQRQTAEAARETPTGRNRAEAEARGRKPCVFDLNLHGRDVGAAL